MEATRMRKRTGVREFPTDAEEVSVLIAVYVKRGLGAPGTPDETISTRMRRFG